MLSVGINCAPLLAPRTGVGRYILGLLEGLRELGSEAGEEEPFQAVPLFAPASVLVAAEGGEASSRWLRARAVARRLPLAYALREAARALELERARGRGLTMLHETNHAAPPSRLPVVVTIHDLSTLLHPETQDPARVRHFARAIRSQVDRVAAFVTPTEAIARQVVEVLGVHPARVRAIHHGLDPALAVGLEQRTGGGARLPILGQPALDRPLLLPRLRSAGVSGPHLLFVGNLEPRKGLPTLLDAYDLLPAAVARGVPLVLAGPPLLVDASLRRRLDARREGRVVELGYVPPDELAGLYRGASALCLPSVYEGFGFPLLEAMACGLPCAASDDPALVEVAGGAALHAPIGDPSALAAILERLLSDSALRRRQVEAGRTRARAFTWRASAARHLAIWRAVAQHQGLPG